MKIILLSFLLPFAVFAQTTYPVVIDNPSTGLKPHQATLNHSNEIASWYNSDIGRTFFGTTDLNSHPLTAFKFDLNGFNTAEIKKGAKISSNKFLTLFYVTGNSNLRQSYLICHDKTGTIYWQKFLDNNLAGPDLEGMDLCMLGDSLIGLVNQRSSSYSGNLMVLDTIGNLLNSTAFTNFKPTLIEPSMNETFWISGIYNNNGTTDGKILLMSRNGTILKEFTLPQLEVLSSFSQDSTLLFYTSDLSFNTSLSKIDSNGVLFSSLLPLFKREYNFQDLIPFKNKYFQVDCDFFQSGQFNALNKDSVFSIVDYSLAQHVLPISDSNALLFSTGPFYGIKSNFNIPHTAINLIDTNFNINPNFGSYCNLMPVQKMATSINNLLLVSTNSIQTSTGTTLINSTITTSSATFSDSTSCMDFYGSIYENQNKTLIIYPNPTTENLTVELGTISISTLNIFSLEGKLIMTIHIHDSRPELDLNLLNPGVYILSGTTENGELYSSRIIKQ